MASEDIDGVGLVSGADGCVMCQERANVRLYTGGSLRAVFRFAGSMQRRQLEKLD